MTGAPQPTDVSGIVLAGGRSSRFGRNKLAEPLNGRPLLHHAVAALAPVVGEIVLVLAPAGDIPSLPATELRGIPVRVVRDPEPHGGPLVGLAAGLHGTAARRTLLVGGDMPALQAPVLRAMVDALDDRDVDVVLLEGPGPVQSMPAAIRTDVARTAAASALDGGARALRTLYDRLRVVWIPMVVWTALDPDGRTLRDVDTPADLGGRG
jgi:molybdopterin-guanine dinucleotide biosynthesis protein A